MSREILCRCDVCEATEVMPIASPDDYPSGWAIVTIRVTVTHGEEEEAELENAFAACKPSCVLAILRDSKNLMAEPYEKRTRHQVVLPP